jgi:hypothetical protein
MGLVGRGAARGSVARSGAATGSVREGKEQ